MIRPDAAYCPEIPADAIGREVRGGGKRATAQGQKPESGATEFDSAIQEGHKGQSNANSGAADESDSARSEAKVRGNGIPQRKVRAPQSQAVTKSGAAGRSAA
jgi:hypothetical protein